MDDAVATVLVAAGVSSTIGVVCAAFVFGWIFGRSSERARTRQNYRLVSKLLWPIEDQGLMVNITKKKIILSNGEDRPLSVSIVYDDHTVVLKAASVAQPEQLLTEAVALPLEIVVPG